MRDKGVPFGVTKWNWFAASSIVNVFEGLLHNPPPPLIVEKPVNHENHGMKNPVKKKAMYGKRNWPPPSFLELKVF